MSLGVFEPPLLHRRSHLPCPMMGQARHDAAERRGAARITNKLKDHGLSISALEGRLTIGSRIEEGSSPHGEEIVQ
jgi:hypothetical protein